MPDLPNATGTLLGMRPGTLRPGHLYRAALEGTSLNLGLGFDRLIGLEHDQAEPRPGAVALVGLEAETNEVGDRHVVRRVRPSVWPCGALSCCSKNDAPVGTSGYSIS